MPKQNKKEKKKCVCRGGGGDKSKHCRETDLTDDQLD